MKQNLFRNQDGSIREILDNIEGISFKNSPLDFFILLARYKFAMRFLRKNHNVIDVGCGHGLGTIFLSKYCKSITGIDLDKDLISENINNNKKIRNISFQESNILNPDKKLLNKFDALVSMDVIEHFNSKDITKVIRNYFKLLNKKGFAVIGTPNLNSRKYASKRRLDTHEYEFTHDDFEKKLKKIFKNVFVFSMTDEVVSTSFPKMSWYLMAICTK